MEARNEERPALLQLRLRAWRGYLPLAFIAALQKTCNLTLAVDVAASILSRLLTDASFREEQRLHCAERAKTFTRQAYFDRQRHLLNGILQ